MGGFKEGASSSPFDADEDDTDTQEGEDRSIESSESTDRPASDRDDRGATPGSELPWIYRRGGARSDRDVTKQLHLQQQTAQRETEFLAELERRLDENVYRADLREAALLVAMDNPDLVAEQLREWGYDYE